MDLLVATAWLAERLDAPDLVVIDGSWRMPDAGRTGADDYAAGHIPGAIFFDIDAIADRSVNLPHMLPSPQDFAKAMGRMGIREDMQAVVYDSLGLFSAPRVWWTLKTFGMERVALLDGGLPKWLAEGRPVERSVPSRKPMRFTPKFDASRVADSSGVLAASRAGSPQIVDARARERYLGQAPEPRPGLRRGHIPGSLNLPSSELASAGRLRPPDQLAQAFARAGASPAAPVIASCGSGITAAVVAFALERLGAKASVYDGSWAEWGGRSDFPIEIADPAGD